MPHHIPENLRKNIRLFNSYDACTDPNLLRSLFRTLLGFESGDRLEVRDGLIHPTLPILYQHLSDRITTTLRGCVSFFLTLTKKRKDNGKKKGTDVHKFLGQFYHQLGLRFTRVWSQGTCCFLHSKYFISDLLWMLFVIVVWGPFPLLGHRSQQWNIISYTGQKLFNIPYVSSFFHTE